MIWLIINIILILVGGVGAYYVVTTNYGDDSARLFILIALAIVFLIGLISGIIQLVGHLWS